MTKTLRSRSLAVVAAAVLSVGVTGCSGLSKQEQRALTGGAIGAGAGAAAGALIGGSVVGGALLGGGGGALLGAFTDVGE